MSSFVYLKNVIKDRHIASIMPTSEGGVRKVCRKINFLKDNVYVEYGPATGIFTKHIVKNMTPGSRIILIERNENFVSVLKKTFSDKRVIIHHGSAEKVEDMVLPIFESGVDYVISGIPFSFFDDNLRSDIVHQTHAILRDGGKFLPYQTFFQHNHYLFDHMQDLFASVKDEYYLLNVPPLRIYEAVK